MEQKSIFEALQSKTQLPLEWVEDAYGPKLKVAAQDLVAVLTLLKKDPALAFDCLSNQTGSHMDPVIRLYYVLYSYTHRHELVVFCEVPVEAPVVGSVVALFGGANWLERETFDLLGVKFTGHPDLTRIMLPEDWVGHPLRKDYVFVQEYNGIDNRPSEITKSFQLS